MITQIIHSSKFKALMKNKQIQIINISTIKNVTDEPLLKSFNIQTSNNFLLGLKAVSN